MKKRRLDLEDEDTMGSEAPQADGKAEEEWAAPKVMEVPPPPAPETVGKRLAAKARRPRHSKYIPCA